jgi:hypothetical protein
MQNATDKGVHVRRLNHPIPWHRVDLIVDYAFHSDGRPSILWQQAERFCKTRVLVDIDMHEWHNAGPRLLQGIEEAANRDWCVCENVYDWFPFLCPTLALSPKVLDVTYDIELVHLSPGELKHLRRCAVLGEELDVAHTANVVASQ